MKAEITVFAFNKPLNEEGETLTPSFFPPPPPGMAPAAPAPASVVIHPVTSRGSEPSVPNGGDSGITQSDVTATVRAEIEAALSVPPDDAAAREHALEVIAEAAERRLAELADQPALQANAVTGIIGDSGTGKTALICTGAEYAWETYHRTTRVYAGDLGGFGNKMLSLIRLGIVEAWNLVNHVEAFETVELASMGYWPERVIDLETGYADSNVRLIPPIRRTFSVTCNNGHVVATVDDKRMLMMFQQQCPTCQQIVTLQTLGKIEETVIRSRGFKKVGLYAYESGSSLSDHAMNDMADRAGRDELGGEKGAINKLISGSMTFGSNNRAHYGFAQTRTRQWLANSRRIPGQVVPALWSFLLDRGSDERNAPVYGPKIAGTAKTSEVPSWMGNCLHAEKAIDLATGVEVHRLWLVSHRNQQEGNVTYLAKHRAEPGTFAKPFLQDEPGQAPFTTFSLGHFFRQIDIGFQQSILRDAKKFPDAPALVGFDRQLDSQLDSDTDAEEIIVSTTLPTANVLSLQPSAPSIGGVPSAMLPPGMIPGAPLPMPLVGGAVSGAVGGVPFAPAPAGFIPGPALAMPAPQLAQPAQPSQPSQATLPAGAPLPTGPVPPPGRPPLAATAAPAPAPAPAAPTAVPMTMPTPAGPMPVPASMQPFVNAGPIPPGGGFIPESASGAEPAVLPPSTAPVRPPTGGRRRTVQPPSS